jgi:putative endonuclease
VSDRALTALVRMTESYLSKLAEIPVSMGGSVQILKFSLPRGRMATEPAACPRACFFWTEISQQLIWQFRFGKIICGENDNLPGLASVKRRSELDCGFTAKSCDFRMLPARFTHAVIRSLDWCSALFLPPDARPQHQQTGSKGEKDAYFYLRKHGYTVVARNFRSPRRRGEIDLIGWDADVLCFIEVKTRTSRDIKPPEAAVDRHKRREIAGVAREYLRHLPPSCQWRFDIVSVYYQKSNSRPQIEVFQNSSLSA